MVCKEMAIYREQRLKGGGEKAYIVTSALMLVMKASIMTLRTGPCAEVRVEFVVVVIKKNGQMTYMRLEFLLYKLYHHLITLTYIIIVANGLQPCHKDTLLIER